MSYRGRGLLSVHPSHQTDTRFNYMTTSVKRSMGFLERIKMRSYRYAFSIVPSGSVAAALTANSLCSFPWYFLSHFESPFPNFLFFKKFFYFSPPLPCFVNRLGNTTKWRSFECHSYHPPSTLINLQTLPPNPQRHQEGTRGIRSHPF